MRLIWTALPLLILAVAAGVLWRSHSETGSGAVTMTCADLTKGCAVPKRAISFGTAGTVKPLQPFQVWVKAPGAHAVKVRFTMQGMDMGFNIYALRPDASGVFRASVTLPMCVSGRRDWNMTVEVDGTSIQVPFSTDL